MSSHYVHAGMYHANSRYDLYPTYSHRDLTTNLIQSVALLLSIIITQAQNIDFCSTANNLGGTRCYNIVTSE